MDASRKQTSATRQKACTACTKAKRRCDLCHPACRRCVIKGIECHYVSTRLHDSRQSTSTSSSDSSSVSNNAKRQKTSPSSTALLSRQDYTNNSYASAIQQAMRAEDEGYKDLLLSMLPEDTLSTLSTNLTKHLPQIPYYDYQYQFFLAPTSWQVTPAGRRAQPRPGWKLPYLNDAVHQVLRWVKQWVDDGSNAFIHKHLYQRDNVSMPKCMQDAYTACAAYFSSTQRNRDMVLRILEDRVRMLLEEEQQSGLTGIIATPGSKISGGGGKGVVGEHLARVQALLVYQVVRLLDGDIRQRALAEELFPTLRAWSMQMLECALLSSQYVQSAPRLLTSSSSTGVMAPQVAPAAQKRESDWQAWILAESVRRTWLVAGHMQCLYGLLRRGISACPGGLMFTTRAGLWQADSADEWWDKCLQNDVLFCRSVEMHTQVVKKASPHEVDDFAMFVLRILSEEKDFVSRWRNNEINVLETY